MEDQLLAVTLLTEQCGEWNVDLRTGFVDFEKAFDTVDHEAVCTVLKDLEVDPCYVANLYGGVKQGDPISALLFIAVMEACFKSLSLKAKTTFAR